jgi:phosphatidylserine/phosphatidylglycerophosphate/cardiolipin synthase-like enzyme
MKRWGGLLFGILIGAFLGVILGAGVCRLGYAYACPEKACVGAADVTPISDRGYFDQAHTILSQARESIHIVSYEVKYYPGSPNSSENRLIRDLIYARERGVDVRVVADEYSQENNAFDLLKANGIEVRMDGNQTTTHAKLIIVDGRVVLLGSTNLSYFGLEKNNEVDLLVHDDKVGKYFEVYFLNLWDKGYPAG